MTSVSFDYIPLFTTSSLPVAFCVPEGVEDCHSNTYIVDKALLGRCYALSAPADRRTGYCFGVVRPSVPSAFVRSRTYTFTDRF